jgi:hypothetical protein
MAVLALSHVMNAWVVLVEHLLCLFIGVAQEERLRNLGVEDFHFADLVLLGLNSEAWFAEVCAFLDIDVDL